MHEKLIEGFLDHLKRETDMYMPFVALLHSLGYQNVHCIGGLYEFGKDILGQKDGKQWLFQLKRGDIGSGDYAEITTQCLEMYESTTGHPDLNIELPRQAVLAFSGAFVGKAPTMFQDFNKGLPKRGYPETEFWTKTRLVELLSAPNCLGAVDWKKLGNFLQPQENGDSNIFGIDPFLAELWLTVGSVQELWRFALEASVLRTEFLHSGLGLHNFFVLFGLLRAACCAELTANLSPAETSPLIELIRTEIIAHVTEFLSWFIELDSGARTKELLSEGSDIVEFSARTILLMEVVSVAVLASKDGDEGRNALLNMSKDFLEHCMAFRATQRPLSDNYAVSIVTIAVVANALGLPVEDWLRAIATWISESYDSGSVGLAQVGATVNEELWRTVGAAIQNEQVKRNEMSMLGVAVLDCACLLNLEQMYLDALHDFRASDIVPFRVMPVKSPEEFVKEQSAGAHLVIKDDFWNDWKRKKDWQNADSHEIADRQTLFEQRGDGWVLSAVSMLLRDRWWLSALTDMSRISQPVSTPTSSRPS